MAIITQNGVKIDTLQEAVANNTKKWSIITGDADVAPSSASGEQIAITSEMDVRNQQTIADAFTQNSVTSATGKNLDFIAEIKNQKRKQNQPSVVYIELKGTAGTEIAKGTLFKCNFNDEEFISEYGVTLTSGAVYVSASSVNIGVLCPSNTISLSSPNQNVTSVINNTDAEVGFATESDGSLRTRLQFIGSPYTNNIKEGLILALREVDNVFKVSILDNNTNSTIDGVPAHSFSPVIFGGNNAEIAKTIFRYMGVGNPSFGDVSQLIASDVDSTLVYNVAFNRPIELVTIVKVVLTVTSEFNKSTDFAVVSDNIIAYINSLKIGEDLILQKVTAQCLIKGVLTATTTLNGGTVNLTAGFKELFITNTANVTVAL